MSGLPQGWLLSKIFPCEFDIFSCFCVLYFFLENGLFWIICCGNFENHSYSSGITEFFRAGFIVTFPNYFCTFLVVTATRISGPWSLQSANDLTKIPLNVCLSKGGKPAKINTVPWPLQESTSAHGSKQCQCPVFWPLSHQKQRLATRT